MVYYMKIKYKASNTIVKLPNNDDRTIFEISALIINNIQKNQNIYDIKSSLEKLYENNFEIGKIVSEIIID